MFCNLAFYYFSFVSHHPYPLSRNFKHSQDKGVIVPLAPGGRSKIKQSLYSFIKTCAEDIKYKDLCLPLTRLIYSLG